MLDGICPLYSPPYFLLHCSDLFDLRQSPAEELPFASGEVDLVMAVAAAHWFDRQKFLLEADRVLRPGGCLALLSYLLDIELEYGDVSDALNDICKEVHPNLSCKFIATMKTQVVGDIF